MLFAKLFNHSHQLSSMSMRVFGYGIRNYKGRDNKVDIDDLQQMQRSYAKDYFDQYRQDVENNTVVRDFRRQIFQKNKMPVQQKQLNRAMNAQNAQLQKLLQGENKDQVNKYSKKIMQHITSKKNMFKGKQTKNVFKDYADYSAYKTNNVSIQDRNYANMDDLEQNNDQANSYKFIQNLPNNYAEKRQIRQTIASVYPNQPNLSISQFGERLQKEKNRNQRLMKLQAERSQINQFKMKKPDEDDVDLSFNQENNYSQIDSFVKGTLSSQVINKIYDLYLQGWTVRDISRRFGIMPARTKFHIWTRARAHDEFIPKLGVKFVYYMYAREKQFMQQTKVVDYGLDLDAVRKTDRYQEITVWNQDRVDIQRSADQYTTALQKLEQKKKFGKYDMVQVGTHGKQNKKHLLKEWKIYRGKKSDDYFLKNKIFNRLMFDTRKTRSIYY